MQDSELRKLLLETCPVKPGQENRAWTLLQAKLQNSPSADWRWIWLYLPSWRGLAIAVVALILIPVVGSSIISGLKPISLATADSQSPGIYATAFYSDSAQAQVVWLNGMEPASDKPTYLDPTAPTAGETETPTSKSHGDPNSL
jgi:hypothetical protein